LANERLRAALLQKGMTPAALADALQVDPKTVERWITMGREPYRRHRYAVATLLGVDETFLWPEALTQDQVKAAAASEIVTVYPHRWAVPSDFWRNFFATAEREIGLLAYSGLFLADDAGSLRVFRAKAGDGVRVRIMLGNPRAAEVAQRGAEEGTDDLMAGRIRNALHAYQSLQTLDGIEVRLHDTTLYNSLYRVDDQLLVNPHIYGTRATDAPVLHLRRVAGGDMVTTYLDSFERIWARAEPVPLP
jgi:transcriptional regulator with XRE-family HTH domain